MKVNVFQTPLFARQKKKLKKNKIKELDKAIKTIVENPKIGEKKKGDITGIWVYKFKMVNQLYLLAYEWEPASRTLTALGVHENFYRNLKKYKGKVFN